MEIHMSMSKNISILYSLVGYPDIQESVIRIRTVVLLRCSYILSMFSL